MPRVHCWNCGSPGHGAASWAALRICHGCGAVGHLLRDCPSRACVYVDMAGVMHAPSLQPLEEVRRTAGVVLAVVAVPAAENVVFGEAVLAEGAVAAAEVSLVSAGSLVDADLLVSLGDSLPLVGFWAD